MQRTQQDDEFTNFKSHNYYKSSQYTGVKDKSFEEKIKRWEEKMDRFGAILGKWIDRLLYYAACIYIGGVIATGKWIWW